MPRDMSKVPKAVTPGAVKTRPPDVVPDYVNRLAVAWYEKYLADGLDQKPMAVEGATYRASWAGSCTRQVQYMMTRQPETDPMSAADAWRMALGTAVHDLVQPVLMEAFPHGEIEKKVDLSPLGIPGAAHVDVWLPRGTDEDGEPTLSTVIEIKSINGFGFKRAATTFNRLPPEGPRFSATVQAALAALALDADRMKVINLSMELLSPSVAAKAGLGGEIGRFAAEWTFSKEEYTELARSEIARVQAVMAATERSELVGPYDPSTMPEGAVIVDPSSGTWYLSEDEMLRGTGRTWQCDYCSFRLRCTQDGVEGTLLMPCPDCAGLGCTECGETGGVPYSRKG